MAVPGENASVFKADYMVLRVAHCLYWTKQDE
jgi:hypothetical protein